MRFLLLITAAAMALPGAAADARPQHRDQDAAYRARQQGEILPLAAIRDRANPSGADFIGADFDSASLVYRLRFMRGSDVIFVYVDARTGRVLGRSR